MKQTLLKIVNPLLFISIILQMVSGVGMGRLQSELLHEIHEINGLVIGILIAIHITLNFKWFITMLRSK